MIVFASFLQAESQPVVFSFRVLFKERRAGAAPARAAPDLHVPSNPSKQYDQEAQKRVDQGTLFFYEYELSYARLLLTKSHNNSYLLQSLVGVAGRSLVRR